MDRFPATIWGGLIVGLLTLSVSWAQNQQPDNPTPPTGRVQGGNGDPISLQFPLNSVNDILPVYERITGKIVIKDSSIFEGPQISLVTPTEVTEQDAVQLIEAALIINGYVLIHEPDNRTVKIRLSRTPNQAASNFNEGELLYTSPESLPLGEALVGYFMQLNNISPEAAATIMSNHVQLNSYGRITPVDAPPGLLISESAAIIRKFIRLKEIIDVPPDQARLMTDLIQLQHADANTVAQIIQSVMDARLEESQRISELGRTISGEQPVDRRPDRDGGNNNQGNNNNNQGNRQGNNNQDGTSTVGSPSEPAAQLIADDRKNRIMVQAAPADFAFILGLIEQFDQPLEMEEPLERNLNHIKVIDALPVVVDLLTDTGGGTTALPGGRSLDTRQTPVSSSALTALTGVEEENQGERFIAQSATEAAGGQADRLNFPINDNTPISVLVGKTRLIADRQANAIIVIGSREAKTIVNDIIDRLDRRPPQVYLALVIGQLTLDDGIDIGVDYLQSFEQFNNGSNGIASSNIVERGDIITNNNVADLRDNLISNALGPATGLNVYGTIGDQFDVFISALESSNRFKVISRPVLSVQNNKKASITSGQKIPTPGQTITDATGGATNAVLNTTIEYQDVVLKLEVIPLINAEGEVTLEIAQINDTVVGQQVIANNTVPIIGTEELLTTVSVPNKQTIVLGGLITEEDQKSVDGVPFVNRIPVVGNAFKSTSRTLTRTELLIFIQPVVVNERMELAEASFDEDVRTTIGEDAAEKFPAPGVPTQQYLEQNPPPQYDEAGNLIPVSPAAAKEIKKQKKEEDRKGVFFWLKQKD